MKKVLLVLAIGFGALFFNSCTDNIEEIENSNEIQTTAKQFIDKDDLEIPGDRGNKK